MASQGKMHGSSVNISEAKDKTIVVGNLPQDAKRELLQCLFPEAVKIFMDMDEHRNRKRGTSLIVFPKVKNALFYTDKTHSIKLDSRLLSIRYLGPHSNKAGGGGGSGGGGGGNSASGSNRSAAAPNSAQSKVKSKNEPPPKANPQLDQKPQELDDDKIVVIQNLPKGMGKIGVLQIIPTAKKVTFKGPPRKSKFESAVLEFNTVAQANAIIKKNGHLKVGDHTLFIESMVAHKRRPKSQTEGPYHDQSPPKSSNEPKERGGGGGDKSNQQKMGQGPKGSGSEDKRFVFMSKRGSDPQQSFAQEMGQYEKDLTNLFNFPKAGTNPAALQYGLAALENLLSRAANMGINDLKELLVANPRLQQLFTENQDFQPRLQKLFAHNQDFQLQLKRLFAANQVFLPKLQMLIAASKQQQSKENFNMGGLGQFGPQGPLRPMGPPQGSMRPPPGSGRRMQGPGGQQMSMQEQQAFKKGMMMRQQRHTSLVLVSRGVHGDDGNEEDDNERDYNEEQEFRNAQNLPSRDGSSGPWSKQDEGRSQQGSRMFDDEPGFPFRRRMNYDDNDDERRPPPQKQQQQSLITEEMEEFAEKQRALYEKESENRDRPPASPSSKRRMYGSNEESMYSEEHSGRQQGFFNKGGDDDFAPPHKRRVIYMDEPERGGPNRHQRPFGGGGGGGRGDNQQDFNEGPRMYGGFGGGRDNFGGGGGRDNFGGGGGGRDNFGDGGVGGRDNFGGGGVPSNREGGGGGYDGPRNREYPGSRPYDEFRRGGGGGGGGGFGGEDDRMGGDGGGGRKSREMFDEGMDFPNRNPNMFGQNEPFHNRGGGDNFSGSMMPPQQSGLDTSGPGPSVGESKLNYVSFDYNHQHSNVPMTDMETFNNNSGNFQGGGAGAASSSSMMGQDSGNNPTYDRHGPAMSRSAGGGDGNQFGQRGMEPSGPAFDNEMDQSYSHDDQFGQRPPQFGGGARNLKSALRNSSAYRFEDNSMSAGNPDQSRDVLSGDFSTGNNNNNNNRMSSDNADSGRGFRDRDREERDMFAGTWRSPLGMGNYQQEREGDMGRSGSGFAEDMSGNRQMDDTADLEQQQMAGNNNNFHGNMDRGGYQYGGNARGQFEGDNYQDWGRKRDGENEGFGAGRDNNGGDGDRRMQMSESHDYGHTGNDGYNRYYGGGGGGGGGNDNLGNRPSYSNRGPNKNNDDAEDQSYNVKWGQGVNTLDRGSSRERNWMSRGEPGDYRGVEDDNNDDRSKGGVYGFQSDNDNNRGSHMYEDNWQQGGDYRQHDNQSDYPGDGSGGHRNESSSFRRGVSFSRDDDLQESSRDDDASYYRSGRSVAFERDNYSYNQGFDDGGNKPNTGIDEGGYYGVGGGGMEQNIPDDRDSYRRQDRYGEQKMDDDYEQGGSDAPLGWRNPGSSQEDSDVPLGWRNPGSTQDGSDPPLGWRNLTSKQEGSETPLGWRNPASKQDGPDPPLGWRNHKYFSSSPSKSDPPSSSRRGRDDVEGSGWERNQHGSGFHGDRSYSGGEQPHRRGRSYGRSGGRGSYGDGPEGDANTGGGAGDGKDDMYGQDSMRKVVLSREWKGDGGGSMRRHRKQSRWN